MFILVNAGMCAILSFFTLLPVIQKCKFIALFITLDKRVIEIILLILQGNIMCINIEVASAKLHKAVRDLQIRQSKGYFSIDFF